MNDKNINYEQEPAGGAVVVSMFFLILSIFFFSSYVVDISNLDTVKCQLLKEKGENGLTEYEYKYGGEKRSCFAKYGKDKPKKEIDITINKTNGLIVQRWFLYTFTCLWGFMVLKEFWAAYRVTKFWLCQRQNRGC